MFRFVIRFDRADLQSVPKNTKKNNCNEIAFPRIDIQTRLWMLQLIALDATIKLASEINSD